MRGSAFKVTLDSVMKMPGIRGALVVAVNDGLVVDGRVHVGVNGAAVAALAASLYRRACQATGNGDEERRFVELEADQGRIMIAGAGDLALMAVVDRRANAGQARLNVMRAAADLEQ
ncbi:MAG: roadblock/LC7 domain-containing protein [Gemmatimonadales bacterium]|jgi:predicted regulator of Ras-like GTPase activity (Roadblock/LC7/MglB family)